MMHAGGRHRDVGRGGRLLLRRPAAAGRPGPAPEGALDGRAAAAVRRHRLRGRAAGEVSRASRSGCAGSSRRARSCGPSSTTRRSRARRAGGSRRSWTRPSSAACWRRCSTSTSSSAPTASARCPASTPSIRTCSTSAARSTACATCRPNPTRGMFGGNSNWRGPIWMPVNALIIRALLQYYTYYGDDFTVECPTGSGRQMNLYQVAEEITPPAGQHLPAGRRGPPAGVRRRARSSRRTRTGGTTSCSTSTSTATTARASAPATRPAGPASSPAPCTCSRRARRRSSSNSARCRGHHRSGAGAAGTGRGAPPGRRR